MLLIHAMERAGQVGRGFGPAPAEVQQSAPSALFETGGHISSAVGARAVSDEPGLGAGGGQNQSTWVMREADGLSAVSLGTVKA